MRVVVLAAGDRCRIVVAGIEVSPPEGAFMSEDSFTLPVWDALQTSEREQVARTVSRAHPQFEFLEIRRHAQDDRAHDVAFFDWCGIEFALIPGAEVTLGYDATRPWTPSAEEHEAYEELRSQVRRAAEYRQTIRGRDGDREFVQNLPPCELPPLREFIKKRLTRLRTVRIAQFLLEVSASTAGIRHLAKAHSHSVGWFNGSKG